MGIDRNFQLFKLLNGVLDKRNMQWSMNDTITKIKQKRVEWMTTDK